MTVNSVGQQILATLLDKQLTGLISVGFYQALSFIDSSYTEAIESDFTEITDILYFGCTIGAHKTTPGMNAIGLKLEEGINSLLCFALLFTKWIVC